MAQEPNRGLSINDLGEFVTGLNKLKVSEGGQQEPRIIRVEGGKWQPNFQSDTPVLGNYLRYDDQGGSENYQVRTDGKVDPIYTTKSGFRFHDMQGEDGVITLEPDETLQPTRPVLTYFIPSRG